MANAERSGGLSGPGAEEPTEEVSGFRRVARIWAHPNGGHFVVPVEGSSVEQASTDDSVEAVDEDKNEEK